MLIGIFPLPLFLLDNKLESKRLTLNGDLDYLADMTHWEREKKEKYRQIKEICIVGNLLPLFLSLSFQLPPLEAAHMKKPVSSLLALWIASEPFSYGLKWPLELMGLKSEGSSRCSPVVDDVEAFVDKEEEEGTIGEGGGGGGGSG